MRKLLMAALFLCACGAGGLAGRFGMEKVEEMLVAEVTRTAIRSYSRAYSRTWAGQADDESAERISPWGINYAAREAVFTRVTRGDHRGMDRGSWAPFRQAILEKVRARLSDPDRLWMTYLDHKDVILQELWQSSLEREIFHFIADVIGPAFQDSERNRRILVALIERDRTTEQLRSTNCRWPLTAQCTAMQIERDEAQRELTAAVEKGYKDVPQDTIAYLLLWRERRRAEGGDVLVTMWHRVFMDLAVSLGRRLTVARDR